MNNTVWQVTVTERQNGEVVTTRICIGCEAPAREFQARIEKIGLVCDLQVIAWIPDRTPEEKARADSLIDLAFGQPRNGNAH